MREADSFGAFWENFRVAPTAVLTRMTLRNLAPLALDAAAGAVGGPAGAAAGVIGGALFDGGTAMNETIVAELEKRGADLADPDTLRRVAGPGQRQRQVQAGASRRTAAGERTVYAAWKGLTHATVLRRGIRPSARRSETSGRRHDCFCRAFCSRQRSYQPGRRKVFRLARRSAYQATTLW